MKKQLITLALSLTTAGSVFAQGQINFNNTSATLGRSAPVAFSGVAGQANGAPVVGTNYVCQLFFASDALNFDAAPAVIQPNSLFRAPTTTFPGTWAGGSRTFVASVVQGQTVNLIVRVWDGSLYANYQAANAAFGVVGQSAPFSYAVPENPPSASQLVMGNFQGFSISPVPEPSTIALGILGAGSLLFLRRKK